MKKFYKQVVSFALIFILIVCSGLLINYLLISKSSYFKLSKNIHTLILGHSHPECAYNDSLIPNVKNMGLTGQAYFYTYLTTKKILSQNKEIKTVLIEFEPGQMDTVMNSWTWDDAHISENFAKYSPILNYPEFRLLWQNNSRGILDYFPRTFIKRIGYNLINVLIKRKNIALNNQFGGYQFLRREKIDSLLKNRQIDQKDQSEVSIYPISTTNIQYLSKIIHFCKLKGVEVFLIRTPVHEAYGNSTRERAFQEILKTSFPQTQFLDFKDFPLENNQFADFGHLNYKGAKIYSGFFDHLLNMNLLNRENKQGFIDSEIAKVNSFRNNLKN